MGEFRPGGRGGFGGNRGGHGGGFGGRGGGFRGNDRGPVVMNKAICDQCHKPCEVPFRPSAGKPVYCNACFGSKREATGGNERNSNYKTPPRTDFGNDVKKVSGEEIKKQIEVLNGKIDRLSSIIEKMGGSKPVVAESKAKEVVKEAPVKKAVKKISKKK